MDDHPKSMIHECMIAIMIAQKPRVSKIAEPSFSRDRDVALTRLLLVEWF